MSLNPDLGHLYHDGNISSIYLKLNVQDKLKTREINARETKYLNKYSQILDRAKSVCRVRNEWEQNYLRTQLKDIKCKTPSLTNSLRSESQRLKNRHIASKSGTLLPHIVQHHDVSSACNARERRDKQNPVLVSSWSVYSDRISRNHSAPAAESLYMDRDRQRNKSEDQDTRIKSKHSDFVKKAEQVTKTLHKLYTQAFERKWKENNMTVLDVLGKESREELEKALFVLRGTRAGDVIEDILKEKELVSKRRDQTGQQSKISDSPTLKRGDSSEIPGDVFVTQTNVKNTKCELFEEMENDSFKGIAIDGFSREADTMHYCEKHGREEHLCTHLCAVGRNERGGTSQILSPNKSSKRSAKSKSTSSDGSTSFINKQWTQTRDTEDMTAEVFKRDETWMMSSTLANASDVDSGTITLRWTDLFKTPELWKQNNMGNKNTKTSPKTLSLVTLTGKRRRTMMKR